MDEKYITWERFEFLETIRCFVVDKDEIVVMETTTIYVHAT